MKKSMFMSTVAMIIVVVVAMSTATFAWFSTFTDVSSTTKIKVEAAGSGLEIRESNFDPKNWTTSPTGWGEWGKELTAININNGSATLAAPQKDIKFPVVTDVGILPTEGDMTQFFAAQKVATGNKIIKMTNAESTVGVADTGSRFEIGYKEFQVRKTGSKANVTCTVTVKLPASITTDKSKLAVDSTKVVLVAVQGASLGAEVTGTSRINEYVIGEKFNYQLSTLSDDTWSPLKDFSSVPGAIGIGSIKTGTGKATALANPIASDNAWKEATIYNSLTPSGATKTFTKVWEAVDGATASGYITIRAYIWNDGHFADDKLGGGEAEVEIKFSVPQA